MQDVFERIKYAKYLIKNDGKMSFQTKLNLNSNFYMKTLYEVFYKQMKGQPRTQALLPTPGAAAKTLVLFGHVLPRIWEVAKLISQDRVDKSKFCHTQIRDAKFVRLLLKFHLISTFSCCIRCIHEIKIYLRQCLHISIKLHIYGIRLHWQL